MTCQPEMPVVHPADASFCLPFCPTGAMVVAAGTAVALLLGVEPLGLGLPGVW